MLKKENNFKTQIYNPENNSLPMLIGFSSSGFLNKWVLDMPKMLMGRFNPNENPEIGVPSAIVSKNHGVFDNIDNNIFYTDLNSTNGSWINGIPAKEKTLLNNGDIINIQLKNTNTPILNFVFQYYPNTNLSVQDLILTKDIDEITLGNSTNISNSKSKIGFHDYCISRRHAALIPRGNVIHVFDFESTNGIYVNSKKIKNKGSLNNMDILRLGLTCGCYSNNKITFVTPIEIKTYETEDLKKEQVQKGQHPIQTNQYNEIPTKRPSDNNKKALQINITRKVVGSGAKQKILLKDINTNISEGDFVLVLGGSGAGKSTFFKAVMGYSQAEGQIFYGDIDVYNDYDRIKYEIGYVPQENLVRFDNSVRNTLVNAAFMKMTAGLPKEEYENRANEVMRSLGLEQIKNNLVGRISGGQLRRVCIGIELTGDPSIFFLDEPDSGLDEPVAAGIREDLRKIANNGKIVLAITHSPDIKSELFTRVVVIAKCNDNSGHLLFSGPPQDALQFFEVKKLSEIMAKINTTEENGEGLADYYLEKWENRN